MSQSAGPSADILMLLPKPRAGVSDADRVTFASSQVVRGRQADPGAASVNSIQTRLEAESDARVVHATVESAFGRSAEAELVERLRCMRGTFGLVAIRNSEVVGHVMFSRVAVDGLKNGLAAVGLAPLSVRRDVQRLGVGTALMKAGLEEVRRRGIAVVVVLGHRDYYPRFGFEEATSRGLTCKWAGDGGAFMVLELVADALGKMGGRVEYDAAFDVF